jgi:hypothetical protein
MSGVFFKSPPTSWPVGTARPGVSGQDGRHEQPVLRRVRLDLLGQQARQQDGALAVPDQDHAPSAVVAAEVLAPGGANVLVGLL